VSKAEAKCQNYKRLRRGVYGAGHRMREKANLKGDS
jgi:hypothetical protein